MPKDPMIPNETLNDMPKELILPIKTFIKCMLTELTITIEALKNYIWCQLRHFKNVCQKQ
jgi:hypothetical protein